MLTKLGRAILEHCRAGASLTPLRKKWTHTPLYEAASVLAKGGLLENVRRGLWRTTAEGIRALEAVESDSSENDLMVLAWPPLALLPTAAHRAFAKLAILAVLARTKGIANSHLPSLLCLGPTLAGKTTTAKILCYAFGVPPEKGVVLLPTETRKSVSIRRTGQGRVSTFREALAFPFVAFDEVHRAPPDVRRSLLHYISGERTLAFENETITVEATALVILNPLAPTSAGLEARTGLDVPSLRRFIAYDLENAPLPPTWRTQGERVLDAAKRAGPAKLPAMPAGIVIQKEAVASLLEKVIRPEWLPIVDIDMVYNLCIAYTAFDTMEVIESVVKYYATVVGTVGWTRENWRDVFKTVNHPSKEARTMGFEPSPLGREVLNIAGDATGLAFEEKASEVVRISNSLGLTLDEFSVKVRLAKELEEKGLSKQVLEEILEDWHAGGRDPKKVAREIAEILTNHRNLRTALKKAGDELEESKGKLHALKTRIAAIGGEGHLTTVEYVIKWLDRVGLSLYVMEHFLPSFVEALTKAGLTPQEAGSRAIQILTNHQSIIEAEFEHQRKIDELAAQLSQKESELNKIREDADKWKARASEWAGKAIEELKRHQSLSAENDRLSAANQEVANNIARGQENLGHILGDVATVEEVLKRAEEREKAAAHREEEAQKREKLTEEKEMALKHREDEMQEDIDAGRLAMWVIWRTDGGYRNYLGACAIRRLADYAEGKGFMPSRYMIADMERYKRAILKLAKPYVDKDYVPRRDHDQEVAALKTKFKRGRPPSFASNDEADAGKGV